MKRILASSALFLAGLVGLFAAAGVYYELRVRQADDFFRQLAWFRDPQVRPVVLLVGDSRMAMNVDPRRLPGGYVNFSYPGETLRHTYLRVKYALRTKPSIRYLVLGLEDVTLSGARAELREVGRQMLFADLADLAEVYPASPRFLVRSAVLHYFPLINATERRRTAVALAGDLRRLFLGNAPDSKTALVCGGFEFVHQRRWADWEEWLGDKWAVAEVGDLLGKTIEDEEMRAVYHKILRLAERHGVTVIGVRNPVTRAYLEAARRHDAGASLTFFRRSPLRAILDYRTLFAERTRFFFDNDHLNGHGAERFTDRLVNDLRPLVSTAEVAPAPCEVEAGRASPSWPYNDVLSGWLGNQAWRNLRGRHAEPVEPPREPPAGGRRLVLDDESAPRSPRTAF